MKRAVKPESPDAKAPTAYAKGLGLLARREHSARELKTKLSARGHSAATSAEAIGKLKERKYQDDGRFAQSLARRRSSQGYGPHRIRAELKSHGIDEAAIRTAIASVDADWTSMAASQLSRRFGATPAKDPTERARRAQFLLRRGFDPATVRAATRAEVEDPGDEFD